MSDVPFYLRELKLRPFPKRKGKTASVSKKASRLSPQDCQRLVMCLLLGCRPGLESEAAAIATLLEQAFRDARTVKILMAMGMVFNGTIPAAQAALVHDRQSTEVDAGALLLAMVNKLSARNDEWKKPVARVLSISVDPKLREMAYRIAELK